MATGDMMEIFPENPEEQEEFVNTTGHTEQTEEDLEDGLVTLFSDENIVTEDVYQFKIEDDIYKSNPINVNGIVKEFKALEDTTTLMKSSVSEAENEDMVIAITDERTSKNAIEATVGLIGAVNEFGHYIKQGSICPVCGKHIDYLPGNGYCSLTCAGKDLLTKITSSLTGEYKTNTDDIIKKIQNIMDYFNLAFNVISKFPDILASFAKLPEEYKSYATAKLNIIFLDIKTVINLLLIQKNKLIIKLLNKVKFGIIDEKLAGLFETISTVLRTADALREQVENALGVAYEAINKANRMFYIGPHEYGFFTTLKSQQCICPFIKKDPFTYPPDQLGMPYWGPGVMLVSLDMSMCQFNMELGGKSALSNIDNHKIVEAVRKVFKNITTPEYLMDPDLFDFRLALSDQNKNGVQKLMNILKNVMVIGGDFLPEYDRLNLTNIWFIVAILTCWGPWTKAIYGDYVIHGFI